MHATTTKATSLGDDLERRRLLDRAHRMEAVVRELELRARFHRNSRGMVPLPLHQALAAFRRELHLVRRKLAQAPPM